MKSALFSPRKWTKRNSNFTWNFEEEQKFNCMHSNIWLFTCLGQDGYQSHFKHSYKATLQSYTKSPMKIPLKIHKNLKNNGVLQEAPCMHDKRLLKDKSSSLVQGGSHCLPLSSSNKKKSLEKKKNPTGNPQKWYPSKAWKMKRRMVKFVFQFGLVCIAC